MRLAKAWIVTSKDFKTFTKKSSILYTIIGFETLISVGLPFMLRFIASKAGRVAVLPNFIEAFMFWFVIGATLLPVSIASYSLVGEKVQKSLEPLLATPTTDEEILAGKILAAFIPAIAANFLGAIIFMILVDLFTHSTLNYYFFPNWDIAIILFVLAPVVCVLSVCFNILISSRSTDVRAAQQLGAMVVIPFAAIYVLTEVQVLTLNTTFFLVMAAIVAVLDVVMFMVVRGTFQREEILTKWK